MRQTEPRGLCFNTQPPEGGWHADFHLRRFCSSFNTQPPEGGWTVAKIYISMYVVSTHSRLKAAGSQQNLMYDGYVVSTHSRLKAAGQTLF